jgi:hypothetical protein
VQKMVSSKSGGGLQGANDGVVEASRPAPDEKPSKSVVDAAVIERLA